MTDNITLSDLTTLTNETGAVATINDNSAAITTAFDNVLFTNGGEGQGQTMQVDLDMNSNHITNLPAPTSLTEPVRLQDVNNLIGGGSISVEGVPTGGTAGQVLTKIDSTNYNTEWSTALAGTIDSGTSGQLAYYSGTGTTLAGSSVTVSGTALTAKSVVLDGSTSGTLTVLPAATAGTHTLTLPAGTTDLSSTGGTSQVLKQTSSGGAITVARLAASDLSNGTTGSGAAVLASSPSLTTPSIAGATLSGTIAGTPTVSGTNFIPYAALSQAGANTLLGNKTGSTAAAAAFTIPSLTQKSVPASTDYIMLSDQSASGALKFATLGSLPLDETVVYTYATLPTPVAGLRAFITDSPSAASGNFALQLTVGGGSDAVPVYSDGTNWYIG